MVQLKYTEYHATTWFSRWILHGYSKYAADAASKACRRGSKPPALYPLTRDLDSRTPEIGLVARKSTLVSVAAAAKVEKRTYHKLRIKQGILSVSRDCNAIIRPHNCVQVPGQLWLVTQGLYNDRVDLGIGVVG